MKEYNILFLISEGIETDCFHNVFCSYDDLKPPTSPSPTPVSSEKEEAKKITETVSDKLSPAPDTRETTTELSEAQETKPLSPYTA